MSKTRHPGNPQRLLRQWPQHNSMSADSRTSPTIWVTQRPAPTRSFSNKQLWTQERLQKWLNNQVKRRITSCQMWLNPRRICSHFTRTWDWKSLQHRPTSKFCTPWWSRLLMSTQVWRNKYSKQLHKKTRKITRLEQLQAPLDISWSWLVEKIPYCSGKSCILCSHSSSK